MRWIALCLALLAVPAWADTGLTQACLDGVPVGSVLPDCHRFSYLVPQAETLVASRPAGASGAWNDPALTWRPYSSLTSGDEVRICPVDLSPGVQWGVGDSDPCRDASGQRHDWTAVVPVAPVAGAVELTWEAPTENEDGSPLTDLAGFKVYWGTAPGEYPNSVTIDSPSTLTYLVKHLPAGTYYFVATAFNSAGAESAYSEMATATIEPPDPTRPKAPAILRLTLRSR